MVERGGSEQGGGDGPSSSPSSAMTARRVSRAGADVPGHGGEGMRRRVYDASAYSSAPHPRRDVHDDGSQGLVAGVLGSYMGVADGSPHSSSGSQHSAGGGLMSTVRRVTVKSTANTQPAAYASASSARLPTSELAPQAATVAQTAAGTRQASAVASVDTDVGVRDPYAPHSHMVLHNGVWVSRGDAGAQ